MKISKKSFINLTIFLLIISLLYYCGKGLSPGIPSWEEIRVPESIIVNDSIKLLDNNILYWYKYNAGNMGYSAGRIGIGKNLSELSNSDPLLISEEIIGIEKRNNGEIKVLIRKNPIKMDYNEIPENKYGITVEIK